MISDPFELQNRIDSLKPEEKSYLHDLLSRLMACKGKSCSVGHHTYPTFKTRNRQNILPMHAMAQTHLRRKKLTEDGKIYFLIKTFQISDIFVLFLFRNFKVLKQCKMS